MKNKEKLIAFKNEVVYLKGGQTVIVLTANGEKEHVLNGKHLAVTEDLADEIVDLLKEQ